MRNNLPPQDHQRALGMSLLQGPREGLFLMSEVPLYSEAFMNLRSHGAFRDSIAVTAPSDGKGANGSKNQPHDAYPARCRVPGHYQPSSERLRVGQLKKCRQLKNRLTCGATAPSDSIAVTAPFGVAGRQTDLVLRHSLNLLTNQNHILKNFPHQFEGLGLRVEGSGFRVQGSGFRVQGLEFRD